ncbi:UNVERIFIED_CONTAM: hypothetical protein RMT77_004129 [Armadillidium vulgare]
MIKIILFSVALCLVSAKSVRQARLNAHYQNTVIDKVLRHAPRDARLISYTSNGPITDAKLRGSLIDNATLIRPNIVGGFDCTGRTYGYYADTNNDCQIFHLCVNLFQIFPDNYVDGDFMDFSFICPQYTIFTQDAMVCDWERSAVPCADAPSLYSLNNNFFVVPAEDVEKVPSTDKTQTGPKK